MIRTVELSLCGLCNLKCSFCPRSEGYPNTNDHMSMETLDVICNHLENLPYEVEVHLSGRGEPTLHKYFPKVVERLLKVDNILLELTTNGIKYKKYRKIISKIPALKYNVYSDDKEEYNQASTFLSEYKGRLMIMHKYSDGFGVENVTNRAGNVNIEKIAPGKGYCRRPFEKILINWNGDYILCCEDWSDKAISNIHKESILEYYRYNQELTRYKNLLSLGIRPHPCNVCTFPG